jgi:hypothetical protein
MGLHSTLEVFETTGVSRLIARLRHDRDAHVRLVYAIRCSCHRAYAHVCAMWAVDTSIDVFSPNFERNSLNINGLQDRRGTMLGKSLILLSKGTEKTVHEERQHDPAYPDYGQASVFPSLRDGEVIADSK